MAETLVYENRLDWIDRMKAFGIYLVVLGHFYSIGEKFIYVFHVPLFFVISGFLNKKETSCQIFWRKLWYNLAIPMLLMAVINFICHCVLQLFNGTLSPVDAYWFVRNLTFGMVSGLDTLWFVYTLIILKIVFQYSCSNKFLYSLTVVMLLFVYAYNHIDLSGLPFFLNEANAVVNVFSAFPFFAFGIYLQSFKTNLNMWNNKTVIILTFICSFYLVMGCYYYNDYVAMYCCEYGSNIFLFLLGGLSGCMMTFAFSKFFVHESKIIIIISKGTIIILGFHKLLIAMIREFLSASCFDILFALLIVLFFVPIIILTEKHFPLLAGKYRINK